MQISLTTEQLSEWKRWRARFGTADAAANAMCPEYLRGKTTLSEKILACYRQRITEGLRGSLPKECLM